MSISSVTWYQKHLDGFHHVTFTKMTCHESEQIRSFRYVIECDEFVYKSDININWSDQVWARAKKMYREQLKHVV